MPIQVTCPNGHTLTVKDEFAGKSGLCPRCKARVEVPKKEENLDDDILSMLGPPGDNPAKRKDEEDVMAEILAAGKRRKICSGCGGETSYSFTTCPTCGTPLKTNAK